MADVVDWDVLDPLLFHPSAGPSTEALSLVATCCASNIAISSASIASLCRWVSLNDASLTELGTPTSSCVARSLQMCLLHSANTACWDGLLLECCAKHGLCFQKGNLGLYFGSALVHLLQSLDEDNEDKQRGHIIICTAIYSALCRHQKIPALSQPPQNTQCDFLAHSQAHNKLPCKLSNTQQLLCVCVHTCCRLGVSQNTAQKHFAGSLLASLAEYNNHITLCDCIAQEVITISIKTPNSLLAVVNFVFHALQSFPLVVNRLLSLLICEWFCSQKPNDIPTDEDTCPLQTVLFSIQPLKKRPKLDPFVQMTILSHSLLSVCLKSFSHISANECFQLWIAELSGCTNRIGLSMSKHCAEEMQETIVAQSRFVAALISNGSPFCTTPPRIRSAHQTPVEALPSSSTVVICTQNYKNESKEFQFVDKKQILIGRGNTCDLSVVGLVPDKAAMKLSRIQAEIFQPNPYISEFKIRVHGKRPVNILDGSETTIASITCGEVHDLPNKCVVILNCNGSDLVKLKVEIQQQHQQNLHTPASTIPMFSPSNAFAFPTPICSQSQPQLQQPQPQSPQPQPQLQQPQTQAQSHTSPLQPTTPPQPTTATKTQPATPPQQQPTTPTPTLPHQQPTTTPQQTTTTTTTTATPQPTSPSPQTTKRARAKTTQASVAASESGFSETSSVMTRARRKSAEIEQRNANQRVTRKRKNLVAQAKQPQPKRRKTPEQTQEALLLACRKIAANLRKKRESIPFHEAVSEIVAPDYSEIVAKPMDMLQIHNTLRKGSYQSLKQFVGDITQMFSNCELYAKRGQHCKEEFALLVKENVPVLRRVLQQELDKISARQF